MHYSSTPAKRRTPGMIWFALFISSLNVVLAGVLLWRGFDFWPNNPQGADLPTVLASGAVALATVLWAVAAIGQSRDTFH